MHRAHAKSAEQAISQTRYALTKCDEMPNGEATDYTDKYGAHIWWTAELVESVPELENVESIEEIAKPNPWTAPAASVSTSSEIAVAYMEKHPDSFRGLESARRTVNYTIKKLGIKSLNGKRPHKYADADVKRIHAYMEEHAQGKHDNAPTTRAPRKAQPVDEDLTRETFRLPDELEKKLEDYAHMLGKTREHLILCAVKCYVKRLGSLTLDEIISKMEANNGNR
jgi:hypothetical protein